MEGRGEAHFAHFLRVYLGMGSVGGGEREEVGEKYAFKSGFGGGVSFGLGFPGFGGLGLCTFGTVY